MIKAFRVMLHPNNVQCGKMIQMVDAARFAYNWAVEKQMEMEDLHKPYYSDSELRKKFTSDVKPKHGWLNEVSNNVTKQAIKDCCQGFQRFRKIQSEAKCPWTKKKLAYLARIHKKPTTYDKEGHPKFKKKSDYSGFYQDNGKLKVSETHVKLEKIIDSQRKNRKKINWIKLAEKNRIPVNAKYANPRITYDGEHWWISVVCEVEDLPTQSEQTEGLGGDLGIKKLVTWSDGKIVKNINKSKKVKNLVKKKKRLQRRVSRKYKMNKDGEKFRKTKNIVKFEKKVLHIDHKLTNIRTNHVHQNTTSIIERNPKFICLEDLNISGLMQNKYLAKHIQEQKWYEFRKQIEYKSAWNHIKVIFADTFFPSSKKCCRCGKINKNLKLKDRIYKCECGNIIDRDLQAAINLYNYGLEHLI